MRDFSFGDRRRVNGLTGQEAAARLLAFGPNALPKGRGVSLIGVFLRQFLSPLIYILAAAALVSLAMSDLKDTVFIAVVLLVNGTIGTIQEYSAERAVAALRELEAPTAIVMREGIRFEIDARTVVPGDLVYLEAGAQVPADLAVQEALDLWVDEALLTGESKPVEKQSLKRGQGSEAQSRAFAGTLVTRGRAWGEVTATGARTQAGRIAALVTAGSSAKPPLMIRLEVFSRRIAMAVGLSIAVLLLVGFMRDMGLHELFLMAVALAVSAIPEGLPVAISVALAVGVRRMARENVVIRRMAAIESLGSCTMIATDKTGTLTLNELTVTEIALPDGTIIDFETGDDLEACRVTAPRIADGEARQRSHRLLRAAALPNEAVLRKDGDQWNGTGDTVDLALLAAARKAGLDHEEMAGTHRLLSRIPYEPRLKFAASFHEEGERVRVFVKGAPETLLSMSDRMWLDSEAVDIDRAAIKADQRRMAEKGLRVLAFAEGTLPRNAHGKYGAHDLTGLVFLGLAGMHDALRPEVPEAVQRCRTAGIDIVMITGDDPLTARSIASQAGLSFSADQVVTGDDVEAAERAGTATIDALAQRARIYARVAPMQKLSLVNALARNGHFVAVTGDGVNDAPALRHAHVGVAMGRRGTAIARESADIILTDDNFASVVAGIRQGRVAYANIRKVVFMVVSTGAAEVLLFLLALAVGLPMPLLPVQLLWLNLVTNGIQDVFLAAEPAEGDELSIAPRNPKEPIFDELMLRRLLHATLTMGCGGFIVFWWLIESGRPVEEARNLLLLLFVFYENIQTFNSRSERHSVFAASLGSNPALLLGVVGAQILHVVAMHTDILNDTLSLMPVGAIEWIVLSLFALSVLAVMEFDKWRDRRRQATGLLNVE